ncbi:hypothetical protein [Xanthobacter sp. ZOL 2024]
MTRRGHTKGNRAMPPPAVDRSRARGLPAARTVAPVVPLRPTGVEPGVVLTPEQLRSRRARSLAIALTLGLLAVLFYVVTLVKLGPGVLVRPL